MDYSYSTYHPYAGVYRRPLAKPFPHGVPLGTTGVPTRSAAARLLDLDNDYPNKFERRAEINRLKSKRRLEALDFGLLPYNSYSTWLKPSTPRNYYFPEHDVEFASYLYPTVISRYPVLPIRMVRTAPSFTSRCIPMPDQSLDALTLEIEADEARIQAQHEAKRIQSALWQSEVTDRTIKLCKERNRIRNQLRRIDNARMIAPIYSFYSSPGTTTLGTRHKVLINYHKGALGQQDTGRKTPDAGLDQPAAPKRDTEVPDAFVNASVEPAAGDTSEKQSTFSVDHQQSPPPPPPPSSPPPPISAAEPVAVEQELKEEVDHLVIKKDRPYAREKKRKEDKKTLKETAPEKSKRDPYSRKTGKEEKPLRVEEEEQPVKRAPVPEEKIPEPSVEEQKITEPPVEEKKLAKPPVEENIPEPPMEQKISETPVAKTKIPETHAEKQDISETPIEEAKIPVTPVEEVKIPITPVEEKQIFKIPAEVKHIPEIPAEEAKIPKTPVEEKHIFAVPVEEEPISEPPETTTKEEAPVAEIKEETVEKVQEEDADVVPKFHTSSDKAPISADSGVGLEQSEKRGKALESEATFTFAPKAQKVVQETMEHTTAFTAVHSEISETAEFTYKTQVSMTESEPEVQTESVQPSDDKPDEGLGSDTVQQVVNDKEPSAEDEPEPPAVKRLISITSYHDGDACDPSEWDDNESGVVESPQIEPKKKIVLSASDEAIPTSIKGRRDEEEEETTTTSHGPSSAIEDLNLEPNIQDPDEETVKYDNEEPHRFKSLIIEEND